MKRVRFILHLVAWSFATSVNGNNFGIYFARHKGAIENYIMEGHGKGWNHCDEISQEPNFLGNIPHYFMIGKDLF